MSMSWDRHIKRGWKITRPQWMIPYCKSPHCVSPCCRSPHWRSPRNPCLLRASRQRRQIPKTPCWRTQRNPYLLHAPWQRRQIPRTPCCKIPWNPCLPHGSWQRRRQIPRTPCCRTLGHRNRRSPSRGSKLGLGSHEEIYKLWAWSLCIIYPCKDL